jgi:hypothetical protein
MRYRSWTLQTILQYGVPSERYVRPVV